LEPIFKSTMSKLDIKSSFKDLGINMKFDLYADKILKHNQVIHKNNDNFYGDLYFDLVAVTFLGKLNTPLLQLFPQYKLNLDSPGLPFDYFIDKIIEENIGESWRLIEKYVKNYKIQLSNSFGERPTFIPILKPFEEIQSIIPKDIEHKYKWYKPYEFQTDKFEKVSLLNRLLFLEIEGIKIDAEQSFRNHLGLKPKSPRWISEQDLYDKIKLKFSNLTVISQASPHWLGRQRFDIYLPEINLAIEYNGVQHYKAVDLFGGEQGLIQTQQRDFEKRTKCELNNCDLLIVDGNYDVNEVFKYINELIEKNN